MTEQNRMPRASASTSGWPRRGSDAGLALLDVVRHGAGADIEAGLWLVVGSTAQLDVVDGVAGLERPGSDVVDFDEAPLGAPPPVA